MALELTITAKGQVTLKQAVLDHLGLRPGQKVGVVFLPDGRVELQPAAARPSVVRARGMLRRPGQRVISLQEMQAAVEAEAVRAVKG
ncbi:AbrB/MazE/SpoVT family DNA-binding domain-containing protein [Nitrospirillum amazonense]|uniref:AbrB/MazE/SpoVT family DNA-binding domain-containing protein n=1 Tax=Nitrospirillum amazonense TaxID=28077 RepID=UPI001B3B86D9|nr:AbrB/MazE/SpoVT family DNA-binding domain-containing protein [Nitrospirillum amazonense]